MKQILVAFKASEVATKTEWAIDPHQEREFEEFYNRYSALALYRIRGIVRDPAAAEEILQDSMLAAARRVNTFNPAKGSIGTWFLTIAKNRALDHLRSTSNRISQQSVELLPRDQCQPCWNMAYIESVGRSRVIRDAMQLLPHSQRVVVEMAFFQDLTGSEIALNLGEPLGTIKTRMRSALKNLKSHLTRSDFAINTAA